MLNIAGPEYDFAHVVFAVLQECEHRRRAFETPAQLMSAAREKLQEIKRAYDEFGGSAQYWKTLHREVMETAMPQYIPAALRMNELENRSWGLYRGGDPAARGLFGLGGLLIGGFVKALPFIPTIENIFVFALAGAGLLYPELVRYTYEQRHARLLNRLVRDAAAYQKTSKLHYMTTTDIRASFLPSQTPEESTTEVSEDRRTENLL